MATAVQREPHRDPDLRYVVKHTTAHSSTQRTHSPSLCQLLCGEAVVTHRLYTSTDDDLIVMPTLANRVLRMASTHIRLRGGMAKDIAKSKVLSIDLYNADGVWMPQRMQNDRDS